MKSVIDANVATYTGEEVPPPPVAGHDIWGQSFTDQRETCLASGPFLRTNRWKSKSTGVGCVQAFETGKEIRAQADVPSHSADAGASSKTPDPELVDGPAADTDESPPSSSSACEIGYPTANDEEDPRQCDLAEFSLPPKKERDNKKEEDKKTDHHLTPPSRPNATPHGKRG